MDPLRISIRLPWTHEFSSNSRGVHAFSVDFPGFSRESMHFLWIIPGSPRESMHFLSRFFQGCPQAQASPGMTQQVAVLPTL